LQKHYLPEAKLIRSSQKYLKLAQNKQSYAVETVVAKLLEQYEVTREQCEAEVLAFLNEIKQEGLLEVR
jgi:hypothetical protein